MKVSSDLLTENVPLAWFTLAVWKLAGVLPITLVTSLLTGLQHEICSAWLGKCSLQQTILFTAWPAGPHLRSSRRSHSVWCLTCNLLICSAWVCFSSWVTRTWTGRKRPFINNLGSYDIFKKKKITRGVPPTHEAESAKYIMTGKKGCTDDHAGVPGW